MVVTAVVGVSVVVGITVVGVSVVDGMTVEGSSVVVIGASRLVVISSVELIGSSVVGVSVVAKIILEWLAPSRTDNNKTEDRDFLLEDTPELQCNILNSVFLTTTHYVSMKMLLQSSMRLNPDRIIVGELRRGEETLELLKAWNSGHAGGLSTIHANDCQSGLMKLEQYLAEVVASDQKKTILEGVDIVVNLIKNEENKRVVREIKLLKGYDENKKEYVLEEIA